jgi:hypothetical protein
MLRQDAEKIIIGSIKELIKDQQYFYYSNVGPDYCHLTEQGKDAIVDIINILGSRMLIAIEKEDIDRSKQLVLNELKKGN